MKKTILPIIITFGIFSPYLVGAVHIPRRFLAALCLFGLICLILSYIAINRYRSSRLTRFFLLAAYTCFIITVCDTVLLRPLLKERLYYRPYDMYIKQWPHMPLLSRYASNVHHENESYGELAAISGVRDYREPRNIVFETDSFGFRNDKAASEKEIDLVLLGDSFGEGAGASQEKTWASILDRKYGFGVYNLSIPGGPWQELMNLKIESGRLKTHGKAVVLWAIFTGNDLTDIYGKDVKMPRFNNMIKRMRVSFASFRARSPFWELLQRIARSLFAPEEARKMVIAKDFLNGKKMLFFDRYARRRDRTVNDILEHKNYKALRSVFDEMKELAKAEDLTVAVVLVPTKEEVYSWVLDEGKPWSSDVSPSAFSVVIERLCELEGFYFLDLKPVLIDEAGRVFEESGEVLWWYDDTHWNDKGHETVSETVYEKLLLPIKKKEE